MSTMAVMEGVPRHKTHLPQDKWVVLVYATHPVQSLLEEGLIIATADM